MYIGHARGMAITSLVVVVPRLATLGTPMVVAASRLKSGQRVENNGDLMKLFNKFLVQRRDGTVPDWPYFVMGAADPAAPGALRQYALVAKLYGMDEEYCQQVHDLATRFEEWRRHHYTGDPDAGPHRTDDPVVVDQIAAHATKLPT